ncbi:MAG: hypothetical protein U9R54_05925, partial [Bacteroidota bacterium]|nr:hypothetical protein [Bacteroidota bacterium]
MKTKISIVTIILILVSLSSVAQFKTETEYLYLKLINNQANKDLIEDNIANAEIVANNIVLDTNNEFAYLFFQELSRSYFILGQNSHAFYYKIQSRVLAPIDSISSAKKKTFLNIAYINNLPDSLAKKYYKQTSIENIPTKLNDRIILILKLTVKLYDDKLTNNINKLGLKLYENNASIPLWYKHWKFLSLIGFNEKQKKDFILFNKSDDNSIFAINSDKNKLKIYNKAIKYYLNNEADSRAKE